jgi:DNA invertase Pin-like site-specific DNA recombinase
MTPRKPLKAYSYLRFSTSAQGDDGRASFRRQTEMAEKYARDHGLVLDTELTWHDLGVSAYRGKNAELGRLGEFLEACRCGLVPSGSWLLVESLDRISRDKARKALRTLEAICEEGITLVTLSDGRKYTEQSLDDDPTDLLIAILTFMRANEESQTKSVRLKDAWERHRGQGKDYKAKRLAPLWITLDRSVEPPMWRLDHAKADVLKKIFTWYLEGLGSEAIAQRLNRAKVPVFGATDYWDRSYILKTIQNPACIGTYVPGKIEYVKGKRKRIRLDPIPGFFPAAVAEDTFQSAQAMLRSGRAGTKAAAVDQSLKNLFSGLARCSACGAAMNSVGKRHKDTRYMYLVCSKGRYGAGCAYNTVSYKRLFSAFLTASKEWLLKDWPFAKEAGRALEEQIETLERDLDTTQDLLKTLKEGYKATSSSTLLKDLTEAEAAKLDLSDRLAELRSQLDIVAEPLVDKRVQDLRAALEQEPLDIAKTNALLRAVFSGILLDPKEHCAEFVWRHGGESTVNYMAPERVYFKRRPRRHQKWATASRGEA